MSDREQFTLENPDPPKCDYCHPAVGRCQEEPCHCECHLTELQRVGLALLTARSERDSARIDAESAMQMYLQLRAAIGAPAGEGLQHGDVLILAKRLARYDATQQRRLPESAFSRFSDEQAFRNATIPKYDDAIAADLVDLRKGEDS